jgi:flavorubredoxin
MATEYGTTYNSYLIIDDKIALIDANHAKLADLSIEKLKATVDPAKIDYIIVQHTEPDHTGSLSKLLDICPNAQVISTKPAAKWIKEIVHRDFNSKTIEDGEEISLGSRTLQFMVVPFWHWPDTMFTYVKEESMLFTCDGFGAHYCDERMYDDLVEADKYQKELVNYYDCIMRPFADKIKEGVRRVKELKIEMICPSHGPILRGDPWKVVNLYDQWSTANTTYEPKLSIFYASAYGNTRRMAEAIAEGAKKCVAVELFDVATAEPGCMRDALEGSKGVAIGSCTINGDALELVWDLMGMFALVNRKGKSAFSFGSYGWSGEGVGMIEDRLKGLRLKVVESGLRFNFVPTEDDLAKCREFGEEFAKQLVG